MPLRKEEQESVRDFIRQNTKLEFASAGDAHGDVTKIEKYVKDCLAEQNLSLIILGGDYQAQPTKDVAEAKKNVFSILSTLRGVPRPILVLGGNYEVPGITLEVASEIGEPLFSIGSAPSERIRRPPGNHLSHQGFDILGVEGSNPINGLFPGERSEQELEWALSEVVKGAGAVDFSRVILATHSPAYECGSRDELGPFGLPPEYCGKHVGSMAYRNFISKQRPLIHDCGHIHEGVGVTVYLWNEAEPEKMEEHADLKMLEYDKMAIMLKKDEATRATICVNHGTLEHWVYIRYRIAETKECIAVEVAKRRLGGKDPVSKFTDRFAKGAVYKKIIFSGIDVRTLPL
jgi:Icc-related predicted phosphoesterase